MSPQAQDGTVAPAPVPATPPAEWPVPAATPAACLEVGAGWLLLLLGGLASLVVLLLALQSQQGQAMRDARLAVTIHDIAGRLEADLALGRALPEIARAQRLVEDAVAQDTSLVAAEVFDTTGLSLFNSDRGSIGEQVPSPWLEATRAQRNAGNPWVATAAGERTIGRALRGPFGEVVGHVSLSANPVPQRAPLDFVVLAPVFVLLAVYAAWRLLRRSVRQALQAADSAAMDVAALRLATTQQRLDDVLEALSTSDAGRARDAP